MAKVKLPDFPIFKDPATLPCPLCGRVLGRIHVDEHHLIPVSQGGKDKFRIHRVCHTKIHSLFTEAELAHDYFTWEALLEHTDIQSFIQWVKRKPSHYFDRNARANRKK